MKNEVIDYSIIFQRPILSCYITIMGRIRKKSTILQNICKLSEALIFKNYYIYSTVFMNVNSPFHWPITTISRDRKILTEERAEMMSVVNICSVEVLDCFVEECINKNNTILQLTAHSIQVYVPMFSYHDSKFDCLVRRLSVDLIHPPDE